MTEQLEHLARKCMFAGLKESELLEEWDYRKGKSFEDVRNAVYKGKRRGAGKVENEEWEIAWELDKVIKRKRK